MTEQKEKIMVSLIIVAILVFISFGFHCLKNKYQYVTKDEYNELRSEFDEAFDKLRPKEKEEEIKCTITNKKLITTYNKEVIDLEIDATYKIGEKPYYINFRTDKDYYFKLEVGDTFYLILGGWE